MYTKGKHNQPLKGLLNSLNIFIGQISNLIKDKKCQGLLCGVYEETLIYN
jgi:hypothetical protein